MSFPEDGHMSCQNMVAAFGLCDIVLYIYKHLLVLISHDMRSLCAKKKAANYQQKTF